MIKPSSRFLPERSNACSEYWKQICDGLVDSDEQVAGTAFHIIQLLMHKKSTSCEEEEEVTDWSALLSRWAHLCIQSIRQNLAAVLYQSDKLDASGRVPSCHSMVTQTDGLGMCRGRSVQNWNGGDERERRGHSCAGQHSAVDAAFHHAVSRKAAVLCGCGSRPSVSGISASGEEQTDALLRSVHAMLSCSCARVAQRRWQSHGAFRQHSHWNGPPPRRC